MSSQRPGRHQRRPSQSVFVLPDNFADLDDVPASGGGGGEEGRKSATAPDAAGGQQARPAAAARHRRAMSVVVASRELDMIKEDMGGYKISA